MRRFSGRLLLMAVLVLPGSLPAQAGSLTVSAAISLTEAFREVAEGFQQRHPDTAIHFNFAASGVLLQQIARGAPVDLFASADQETMDTAERQGLLAADSRQDFVRNTLVLVAPADSELAITDIAGLANAPVQRIALGNPDYVPAGRYGKTALDNAGLWDRLADRIIPTQNVRQALDYVVRGEVDAGFVYATDARLMAERLTVLVEIPLEKPISYPVAIVEDSANAAEAERFIAYLLSAEGQAILASHGFSQP